VNTKAGGRGPDYPGPRSLDELIQLRTDYEDVPVSQLGGEVLRVYALTGAERARLISQASRLEKEVGAEVADSEAALLFPVRIVGASLRYPEDQWVALGEALGAEALDDLYKVASRLSGVGDSDAKQEKDRQPEKRNAASGSD